MTQRTEAILILRQARDVLLARLAERVVEAKEEILDDAQGGLFQGGIDEIYEQLVTRLSHVNAMLNLLPADEPAGSVDTHPLNPGEAHDGMAAATVMDTNDVALGGRSDTPALPAPHFGQPLAAGTDIVPVEIAPLETAMPEGASFRAFGTQIFTGDLDAAGESLAELFNIDPARGRRCAEAFAKQLAQSPEFMTKAMSLRKEIAAGNFNASLMLLYECFSLQGMEAIRVLQTLMGRLGTE